MKIHLSKNKHKFYSWIVPFFSYCFLSLLATLPLFLSNGMPGHTIDWLVPDTNAQVSTFVEDTHYLWWNHALGFFDYYAFDRPLQMFGSFTLLLSSSPALIVKLWLLSIMTLAAYSMYFLCRYLIFDGKSEINEACKTISCFIGGWIFAYGPLRFNMMMSGELFSFEIAYMLLPLGLLLIKKALIEAPPKNLPVITLSSFVNWLISGNLEFLAFLLAIALAYAVFVWRRQIKWQSFVAFVIINGLMMIPTVSTLVSALSDFQALTKYSASNITHVLNNWPYVQYPFGAISLAGYPWEFFRNSIHGLQTYIWLITAVSIIALAYLSIATRKNEAIIAAILSVLFVILACGLLIPQPLSELAVQIYRIPFFATLFQDPVYWMFALPPLYGIMITQSSYEILVRIHSRYTNTATEIVFTKTNFRTIIAVVILVLILIGFTYPLFTGLYLKYLGTFQTSHDLNYFQTSISKDPSFFRVLYIPTTSVGTYTADQYQSGSPAFPNNYPVLYGRNPAIVYSPGPALDAEEQTYDWSQRIQQQIINSYSSNDTDLFNYLLQVTYSKYVVVLTDFVPPSYLEKNYNVMKVIAWLKTDTTLKLLNESDRSAIFANKDFVTSFYYSKLLQSTIENGESYFSIFSDSEYNIPLNTSDWHLGALSNGNLRAIGDDIMASGNSEFDIYARFPNDSNFLQYWGVKLSVASNITGSDLNVAFHSDVWGSPYASYDLILPKAGSFTFYVPFTAFSLQQNMSFARVNMIDLIFSPSIWLIKGITLVDSKQLNTTKGTLNELNPTIYEGNVNSTSAFILVLPQSFDSGWKIAVVNSSNGRELDPQDFPHIMVLGYANGWIFKAPGNYEIKLWFGPQVVYDYTLPIPIFVAFFVFCFSICWNKKSDLENIKKRIAKLSHL